ncbi:MAG TPA: prolipoprotein diacylglyceryl transferase [Gammaproteobacteria bacterium]|jgi:phosphatidylglycerol:prolipoprotein diacylglycerol transferase|nr:prolipoprotein diacylglyceryl transferase [Gammaproteobacteria bacterium]
MIYPHIDPIALSLGTWHLFGRIFQPAIHWYGITYLVGFLGGYWCMYLRSKRPASGWTSLQLQDLLFYVALGVVLGGRAGYMLFYDWDTFSHHPETFFFVWNGGMSFHGGLLGVMLAMWIYGRQQGRRFFDLTDFIAPVVPIGLGAGRLGNFINGELWGKVTDLPWGMRLDCADPRFSYYCGGQNAGYSLPHHPSQLYEFLLEGVTMFIVLWLYSSKKRPRMAVSGLFGILYGSFRFLVEFVRMPDQQIGYLALGWLTMGQILSLPLIAAGITLMVWAYRRERA